ncbi:MAG: hypothetical protein JSR83_05025 [Proteobacteria bacterium]|nr:hypothetical protein [Pseudomonadota bacterium]
MFIVSPFMRRSFGVAEPPFVCALPPQLPAGLCICADMIAIGGTTPVLEAFAGGVGVGGVKSAAMSDHVQHFPTQALVAIGIGAAPWA